MRPPYLPTSKLFEGMAARPKQPFFLRPQDYRVVDGDTFAVMTPPRKGEKRATAFRIRLYSVNAAEKPKPHGRMAALRGAGIDPFMDSPGQQATEYVREICEKRALYIEMEYNREGVCVDDFGRLLANVTVSGSPGATFDLNGAYAIGPHLIRKGHAMPMRGKEVPPDLPLELDALRRDMLGEAPSFRSFTL